MRKEWKMNEKQIIEKLKEIVVDYIEDDNIDINKDTVFKQDLGLNSLDLTGLICDIEDEFGVEITEREIVRFRTVDDVVNYLKK